MILLMWTTIMIFSITRRSTFILASISTIRWKSCWYQQQFRFLWWWDICLPLQGVQHQAFLLSTSHSLPPLSLFQAHSFHLIPFFVLRIFNRAPRIVFLFLHLKFKLNVKMVKHSGPIHNLDCSEEKVSFSDLGSVSTHSKSWPEPGPRSRPKHCPEEISWQRE